MTNKIAIKNRANFKVHQTTESYLKWFDKAYPEKKKETRSRYRKTCKNEDYVFKRDYKEIIITFD